MLNPHETLNPLLHVICMRWSGREEFSEVVNVGVNHDEASSLAAWKRKHQPGSWQQDRQPPSMKRLGWRLEGTRNPVTHHPSRNAAQCSTAHREKLMGGCQNWRAGSPPHKVARWIHHTFLFGTWRCQKAVNPPEEAPFLPPVPRTDMQTPDILRAHDPPCRFLPHMAITCAKRNTTTTTSAPAVSQSPSHVGPSTTITPPRPIPKARSQT